MMTWRKFCQLRLTLGEPHWLSMCTSSLRPPALVNYAPDFGTHQIMLGDFNSHYSSWFSRTGEDRAASRGDAHPSPRASPPRCVMVHPQHPWVWPSPHNHLPLQSRPALTVKSLVFHELPQGWLGVIHSRIREEICRYPSTNLLFCRGKSLQADPRRCRKTPHPLWLCQGLPTGALFPKLCDPSSQRERSAPHWRPSRLWHQAAGPGHPAAHPPGCTRPVEVPSGILHSRYQSQTLLVLNAQAGRQEVESPT